MVHPAHHLAQELSSRAALLLREADSSAARALFAQAADLEEKALVDIPADKVRTRGILAVSYASLLYKAKLYDRAERALFQLLGQDNLLPAARQQLRELLEDVRAALSQSSAERHRPAVDRWKDSRIVEDVELIDDEPGAGSASDNMRSQD